MLWISISMILLLPSIYSACTEFNCEHNGVFNKTTCKCDCYASYIGNQCEFGNCNFQPISCSNFGASICSEYIVRTVCPKLCNQPICECGFDSCLNGGTFNNLSCTCNCPAQFYGQRCSNPVTTTTPSRIDECKSSLKCKYGGIPIFDINNGCVCECYKNFSGNDCSNFIYSVTIKDPKECESISCDGLGDNSITAALCPIKCLISLYCEDIECLYGKKVPDPINKSCQCECQPNFSGPNCVLFDTKALEVLYDSFACNTVNCKTSDFINCPTKCLFCSINKPCRNGILKYKGKSKICECECIQGFEGDYCQIRGSDIEDSPACKSGQFGNPIDCSLEISKSFCPKTCLNILNDRCNIYAIDQCDQVKTQSSGKGTETFEYAIMSNPLPTGGTNGEYDAQNGVFKNTNSTFTFDQIIHYNSKITLNSYSSIIVSGKTSFNAEISENIEYTISGGNIIIYSEQLLFSSGSARLVASSSKTSALNPTYYLISATIGSFTFYNMPLTSIKGIITILDAEINYKDQLYKNINKNISFDSLSFTLNSPLVFSYATYFVDTSSTDQYITGTSFSFESAHFDVSVKA